MSDPTDMTHSQRFALADRIEAPLSVARQTVGEGNL